MSTTARGSSGGSRSATRDAMHVRRVPHLPLALVAILLLAACSTPDADVGQVSTSTTVPATTLPDVTRASSGVLYIQHGVSAEVVRSGDVFTVSLEGVERRTEWLTDDASGVATTTQVIEEWDRLGLDDAPQAALVPADLNTDAVLLTLREPQWSEEYRTLEYEAAVVDEPDPRLAGMVPDLDTDPVGQYTSVTLIIHQPNTTETPSPTTSMPTTTTTTSTTTTSTTSTTTTPSSPSTGATTTTVSTPGVPVTGPPPTLAPPPTPLPTTVPTGPTVTRPPDGEPEIVADVTELWVESVGGSSTTFTLRNVGSGVGSWSTAVPAETGLSLAPSSGLLFPDRSTVIRVTYDGSGPNNDFAADIILTTASGRTPIRIKVYPPA